MWFLRDAVSGEKVSQDFSSQTKLARFMQILPQTFHKAIKEGRNGFKFHERKVKVVQEKVPHWALFGFSSSEKPIETFETVSDLAKWLQVTNQAVYAAMNRGLEPQIKNKDGTVFWLRKFQEAQEDEASLPQENPPLVPLPPVSLPSIPAWRVKVSPTPRVKVPPPPAPSPQVKVSPPRVKVPPTPRVKVSPPPAPPPQAKVPPPPPVPAPRTKKVPPVPAPRTKVPPPPVPAPRVKVPPPPVPAPQKKPLPSVPESQDEVDGEQMNREYLEGIE